MELLIDVGGFAAKTLLLTVALLAVVVVIANLIARFRPPREQLEVENINDRFQTFADVINQVSLDEKTLKAERKARAKAEKERAKSGIQQPRVFVTDFDGDIRASDVERLRDAVTAILTASRPNDEVVVRLESTGGTVHGYGLAAAQLMRIRERGLKLTVCVDKVAASGGYMMACTANQILAAPFAVLGSIGVIAQVPNLHRVLKKHDIDYEELTAGEFKRTVSLFAEITSKGRQKFLDQLEDTHRLFKEWVKEQRPQLDLEKVATGEHWFGRRALELGLCDKLISSDDYLYSRHQQAQILQLNIEWRKSLGEKIADNLSLAIERAAGRWWQRLYDDTVLGK